MIGLYFLHKMIGTLMKHGKEIIITLHDKIV